MNESQATVRVWSLAVRVLHWALAFSVLSALALHEFGEVHEWLGYAAIAIATLRVLMGLAPWPRRSPARFANFVRGPKHTLAYAGQVVMGSERRHLGHNPLGAWMVVSLLGMTLLAAGTGALYVTDTFWGMEWLEEVHEVLGWTLACLVPVHVLGAIHASRHHRENLVASMVHGRKRPPAEGDVT